MEIIQQSIIIMTYLIYLIVFILLAVCLYAKTFPEKTSYLYIKLENLLKDYESRRITREEASQECNRLIIEYLFRK
jgi:hypothetical protein